MFKTILLGVLLFGSTLNSFTQTTQELFSTPGLSVNSFHFNFFDGNSPNSWTYVETTELCSKDVTKFIHNHSGHFVYLYFEDSKVYQIGESNCQMVLYFDFDLQLNDVVPEGVYQNFMVNEVGNYQLLNGETRRMLKLGSGFNQAHWVEGIGDLFGGISPMPFDFEGGDNFVCAKIFDTELIISSDFGEECDEYSCIHPFPNFEIEVEEDYITIIDHSEFVDTYLWDFGDGTTSSEINPMHAYTEEGCYGITLTVSNACFGDADPIKLTSNICFAEPWVQKETFDSLIFGFNIEKFSDQLQFLYTNTTLLKSVDEGQNWTAMDFPNVPGVARFIQDIAMYDDLKGIAVCGHYGAQVSQTAILTTNDGGASWTERAPGSYFLNSVTTGENGLAWAAGNLNKYYRSTDYGATWENITYPGAFNIYETWDMGTGLTMARAYEGLQPSGKYFLANSSDQGVTWNKVGLPDYIEEFEFLTPLIGYGYKRYTADGLYKSIDGGSSWNLIYPEVDIREMHFVDEKIGWLSTSDGLVYYTIDGANSFVKGNCGNELMTSVTALDAEVAYGVVGNSIFEFDLTAGPDCIFLDPVKQVANTSFNVYPNPVKDILVVESEYLKDAMYSIKDIFGNQMQEAIPATSRLSMDLSHFASGVYVLEIMNVRAEIIDAIKFIKIE